MTSGWTKDRRKRQAIAIHRWKPWIHATGPKTVAGKAAVARNAWKTGLTSAAAKAERRQLRELIDHMKPFAHEVG